MGEPIGGFRRVQIRVRRSGSAGQGIRQGIRAGVCPEGYREVATSPSHGYEGGCLCGAIRYASRAAPLATGYCHCRLCQRSSGAPVLAWGSFPVASFAYRCGDPTIYRSSPHGQREFCASCGSQLAYRESDGARTVDVNLATLDHPEAFEPRSHLWTKSRIRWFETADELPRFEDGGPPIPPG